MLQYYAAGETVIVTVKTPGHAKTYEEREFSVTLRSALSTEAETETEDSAVDRGNIIIH